MGLWHSLKLYWTLFRVTKVSWQMGNISLMGNDIIFSWLSTYLFNNKGLEAQLAVCNQKKNFKNQKSKYRKIQKSKIIKPKFQTTKKQNIQNKKKKKIINRKK